MLDDRYTSLEWIGEGEEGKVYRAFDRVRNRSVALKRTPFGETQHEEVDGMLEEIRTLGGMSHPNLVTIHDTGRDGGDCFIVMEWVEGENLEALSRHGKMLYEHFLPFALQIQEAMIAAHELGILHRDIKPANVMLRWLPSGSPHIKLLDFGLTRLTQRANLMGSLHFMSPEQFEKQPADIRSDLYSLGCLYYFALTQRRPFAGDSTLELMISHLHHRVTPLHEVRPDLPSWLCDWVMWHLERQPTDRPESVMAAFQRLKSHTRADVF